ncbi:polysaccharide deacetylase family protein [Streptosporangium sp. NPDC020145]|uniref:polysaccharide deacetylase family protein n=1 Tax=Streptosporangium sp. NPDC020145 TaxID=3154694 RepID=UPI00341A0D2E
MDPADVPGLTMHTVTEGETGGLRAHAVYPSVSDAPRLTERLHRTITEHLRSFNQANRGGTETGRPGPEFNVDWQLPTVSTQMMGVNLTIGRTVDSRWSEEHTTVWYDRVDRRVLDSADLLKDKAALGELARLTRDQLGRSGSGIDPEAITADARLFDSLAFNRRGDLVAEFDDQQVGAASLSRVAVPAAKVKGLLSPAGERAQRSAVEFGAGVDHRAERMAKYKEYAALPVAESTAYGSVDCAKVKCVALTYDDGPGPGTGKLLDALNAQRARATFFAVGTNSIAHTALLRRIMREGHLVGDHTWSHRDLTTLDDSRMGDQFGRAQCTLGRAVGRHPGLVRPPYGAVNDRVPPVARQYRLALVRWNVDAKDLQTRDPKAVADRVVSQTRPGSIVLMHDVGGTAAKATPEILRRLRDKGYTFVTVPELYGKAGMKPGEVYDSGEGPREMISADGSQG